MITRQRNRSGRPLFAELTRCLLAIVLISCGLAACQKISQKAAMKSGAADQSQVSQESCQIGDLEHLDFGIDPVKYCAFLKQQIGFIDKALKKNPQLKVLDPSSLDRLMSQRVNIGFAGYSSGSDFDEMDTKAVIGGILSNLNSQQYILLSGATDVGLPKVLYEVAKERSFPAIGITSWNAGKYEPAFMSHVLTVGNSWGGESRFFLEHLDILVVYGGGPQTLEEMREASRRDVTIIAIRSKTPAAASNQFSGRIFETSREASAAIAAYITGMDFYKWLISSKLKEVSRESARYVFAGKKLIGFSGWSNSETPLDESRIRSFVVRFLKQLDPKKVVIVTGGTELGPERIVHEIAKQEGFTIVAAVSHRVAKYPEQMFKHIDFVVPISRTWEGRNQGFITLVDGLVSFGGGGTVIDQVKLAAAREVPFRHLQGSVPAADEALAKFKEQLITNVNDTARAAKTLMEEISAKDQATGL